MLPAGLTEDSYSLAAYAAVNPRRLIILSGSRFLAAYAAVNVLVNTTQFAINFLAAYAAVNGENG